MTGPGVIRALVVDDEPSLIEDYEIILSPRPEADNAGLYAKLEKDLFGAAVHSKKFPKIDLATFAQGRDAVEAVRLAVDQGQPFAVAFIDLYLSPGLDGLQTAEQIRSLDPAIHIVLVSAHSDVHPLEMCERVPPADQLFFVKKPFHAFEIQQLVLSLTARWRAEHWYAGTRWHGSGLAGPGRGGLSDTLEALPSGVIVFDRRDRLLAANEEMAVLFPELADLFISGTPYEEIQRQMAEKLLPENTLVRVDTWVKDRLDWHARSGGALEHKLRGSRWVLLIEGGTASGETYCLYYDITMLKRREVGRATAAHMTQMAQSFGALCERLDLIMGETGSGQQSGSSNRHGNFDIAKFPGAIAGGSGGTLVQSLTAKLQAVAQRQKLAPESIDLNRVVGDTVRKLRTALLPNVEAEVIAGAGLWPVLIDTAKFNISLAEVIKNACEAMRNNGRLVLETSNIRLNRDFVATRPGLSVGEYVRLSIQDTGPGMSPELVDRALNPFFTSKDKTEHLGLGLSAAYGFACQSGGYIEVDGGEGRGATVDLYFPKGEEIVTEPVEDGAAQDVSARGRIRPAALKGRS